MYWAMQRNNIIEMGLPGHLSVGFFRRRNNRAWLRIERYPGEDGQHALRRGHTCSSDGS